MRTGAMTKSVASMVGGSAVQNSVCISTGWCLWCAKFRSSLELSKAAGRLLQKSGSGIANRNGPEPAVQSQAEPVAAL